ncbi:hypothetical protein Tco_1532744 [Tanacetum coccineum]
MMVGFVVDYLNHGLGFVIVAIGKKLVVVLVGIVETVSASSTLSTDTLQLLTNEQKAFRDNLHKSGVGYNGSCVLSQAYAKIPKLYRASELCDKNEQLHVFDSEETLEDAEKSQLKMNEFQKDKKIQELKIQPINYEKLNKLYKDFVP